MTGKKWLLYFAVVGTVASQSGKEGRKQRKLKTPPQRLKRLIQFANEWLSTNIRDSDEGPSNSIKKKIHDRIKANVEKRTTRMLTYYNRENPNTGEKRCGFYDENTTYGGPQVEAPKLTQNKIDRRKAYLESQRNKRHLIIDEFKYVALTPQEWHHVRRAEDIDHIEEKIRELEKWFEENLDDKDDLSAVILTDEDDAILEKNRHRRDSPKTNQDQGKFGTANSRYNKNDPVTGWKQICTGFRKWSERYIAYCGQEYIEKSFSKWATEKLWRGTEKLYRCKILEQDRDNC
jgi:hypothetical protein